MTRRGIFGALAIATLFILQIAPRSSAAADDMNLTGLVYLSDGTTPLSSTQWANNTSFAIYVNHGNDWSGVYWKDPNGTVRYSDVSRNGLNWPSYHSEDMAGVAIVPSNNPVYVAGPNPDISHNTFEGNTIGVYAGAASPGITRNDFVNNSEGVWAENAVASINNNTFEGMGDGIWALNSYIRVFDNTIKDTVGQYASNGVYVLKASTALIVNNSILDMGNAGIYSCKSNIMAYKNIIEGFIHAGILITYGQNPPGACPGGSGPWNLDVQNNTISSGGASVSAGIAVWYGIDSFTIRNNTINNISASGAAGIDISDDYSGDVSNNSIKDNYYGLVLAAGILMFYNNIERSSSYGAQQGYGSGEVDARSNWWGDDDGPYDGSSSGSCPDKTLTSGDEVKDDQYSSVNWCGTGGAEYLRNPAKTGPY